MNSLHCSRNLHFLRANIARVILGDLGSAHQPAALQVAVWVCFHLLCSKSNISTLKSPPPASSSQESENSGWQLGLRWALKWNIYVLSFALPSSWKDFQFTPHPTTARSQHLPFPPLPLWPWLPCSFQATCELLIQNHVSGDWLTGNHSEVASDSSCKLETQQLPWSQWHLTAARQPKEKRSRILHGFMINRHSSSIQELLEWKAIN